MRRIILILSMMFISIFSLFAGTPGANPQRGGFGIDMASTNYNLNFETGRHEGILYDIKYKDEHIIALGGVWDMTGDEHSKPMTVTITCPNGFYFESISNPGARRPFKVYAIVKESYSNTQGASGTNTNKFEYVYELEEGTNSISHTYDYETWAGYEFMWFDLVLSLPYDDNPSTSSNSYVSSDGRMYYDGRAYNLIEADDYSAIITVRVEWNGKIAETTIPLGGYYSKNITSIDTTTSLSVRPMASASNLSIETMQGRVVDIANINFMAIGTLREEKYTDWGWDGPIYKLFDITRTYQNQPNYYMFLSSSRNPFEQDVDGFRLVRVNRGYSESPYTEDYISYDLRLTTNVSSKDGTGGSYVDFDGTDYVSTNVPTKAIDIPFKAYEGTGALVRYAQFDGTVSIIMDQKSTPMNAGIYEDEVYVHIVSNEDEEKDVLIETKEREEDGLIYGPNGE